MRNLSISALTRTSRVAIRVKVCLEIIAKSEAKSREQFFKRNLHLFSQHFSKRSRSCRLAELDFSEVLRIHLRSEPIGIMNSTKRLLTCRQM